MGLKFSVLGEFKDENMKDESPPKHVIQCKKCGDTPKNVFSRAWQEK